MFCSKCGSPLSGASVCPSCGTPVTEQPVSPPMPPPAYEEASPYMEFGPLIETVSPPASTAGTTRALHAVVQPPAPAVQAAPLAAIAPLPSPLEQPRRQQQHATWISALSTFLVLLVISAAGLLSYTAVIRPAALNAHATAVAQAFLTAQAQNNSPQHIYQQATRGKPTFSDPLNNPATSIWDQKTPVQSNCLPETDAYHILVSTKNYGTTCSSNLSIANFALQVQMAIFTGSGGGVLFRSASQQQGYFFGIDQWGFYNFNRVSQSIYTYQLFTFKSDHIINEGQNPSNLLTIIALGNRFYLYVNKQSVGQFTDNAYRTGALSLQAFSGPYPGADVAFSNLQIWRL